MSICVPKGFLLAGVHCRIKRDPQKQDLTLVMSEEPATGVGVYTQNLVCAAPVEWDRSHTPSGQIRAVVICSGVANACTGERGLKMPGGWPAWPPPPAAPPRTRPWCSPPA